ncbi:hypothetical protein SteCoe_9512 [Stentor coeruleus]|uniref:EF-hand domain-containing protein n=1 Tax=Stentor coeruleus TaxID=5963 RepID=A0A1R2CHT6_9CILI|nr:hypothetical protein SteCoe_9512 [Stentor coeruleus]
MGCTGARSTGSITIEKNYFEKAFEKLGLDNNSAREYDNHFHRYANQRSQIPDIKIKKICSELNLNPEVIESFFDYFIDEEGLKYNKKYYFSRKLSTTGIIFGNGSLVEKLKLLFGNYDIDTSRLLSKFEIREMLKDVVEIHLVIIPKYIEDATGYGTEIKTYAEKCFSCKDEVIELLYDLIIESNESITLKQFIRKFTSPILLGILDGAYLRESAYKFSSEIQRLKEKNDNNRTKLTTMNSIAFMPEPHRKLQTIRENSLSS